MQHGVLRTEDAAASPALYWIPERERNKKLHFKKQGRKGSRGKEDSMRFLVSQWDHKLTCRIPVSQVLPHNLCSAASNLPRGKLVWEGERKLLLLNP